MNPVISGKIHYPALDALRGLAILLVLLHHYFSSFQIGWIGVDLFFVLSGFLITEILLKESFSKAHILRFYARRALRILPVYYGILVLFFLTSPFLFSDHRPHSTYQYYQTNQIWFWTFLQNWLYIKKGPPPEPYLSHFWSLAVEWQFYLAWPLVLHLAKKHNVLRAVIVSLIALSITVRVYLYLHYPDAVENYYNNTICRMDSLLIGSFLAVHLAEGKTFSRMLLCLFTVLCLSLLLICGFVFNYLNNDNVLMATVGYTVFALFFMSLLYWVLTIPALKRTTIPPLNFLGTISYGMYVYHLPVYLTVAAILPSLMHRFFAASIDRYSVVLISFALTVSISAASYQLFEKPMLRLKGHNWRALYRRTRFRLNLLTRP